MKIFYFGEPYSFTHVASLRRFGRQHSYVSKSDISETVEAALSCRGSIAVVPIENTTGGHVADTIDAIYDYRNELLIEEELEMAVEFFLLAKNKIGLHKIRKVFSHDFALKRAESWLKKNTGNKVELISTVSTSEAALNLSRKGRYSCAIAGSEAAEQYGLVKLKRIDVKGKKYITRFFVIVKNEKTRNRI